MEFIIVTSKDIVKKKWFKYKRHKEMWLQKIETRW